MFVAPDAELDDGLLDVVTRRATSASSASCAACAKIFKGEHREVLEVQTWRGSEVRIEADRPFAVYADGDHIADLPATVTLLPRALTVIVPGAAPTMSGAGLSRQGRARARDRRAQPPQRARRRHDAAGAAAAATRPGRDLAPRRRGSPGGSTIISATNGKTTTAGMLAAAMRAAGRDPGPQPRRLEHELGRRHGAARAARRRGPVRGRRGVAAEDRGRARPEPDRARQPVSRPARPLRRARAPRRRVGRAGRRAQRAAAASCSTPTTRWSPTSGRDATCAAAPGVTYFGIEDPSQALPELQHAHDAKHCRRCGHPYAYARAFVGHLGHYECPNCGADRPAPDVAATEIELLGMRGSRSLISTPGGEARLELPLPGLYNVYNALAAIAAALRLGIGLEQAVAGARRGRGGVRPGRDDRGRRHAGLDPADQEPRRRERGPAHAAPRGRPDGEGLDLWIALNDRIADGRDVSWIWDADFELLAGAARRVFCAGHAGAGDGGAAQVRRDRARADRGRAVDRALPRPRRRRGRRRACSRCPPTRR